MANREQLNLSIQWVNAEQIIRNFTLIRQVLPTVIKVTFIRTICEAMNSQVVYKSMLSEVHNILRLYLTMPITSATSERSFFALKVVNTYLCSSMFEQSSIIAFCFPFIRILLTPVIWKKLLKILLL